jgi:hypothetical protein
MKEEVKTIGRQKKRNSEFDGRVDVSDISLLLIPIVEEVEGGGGRGQIQLHLHLISISELGLIP